MTTYDATLALERRAHFNQLMRIEPLPESVEFGEESEAGVCGLRLRRLDTAPDPSGPVLLYLHGGGYIAGTPRHGATVAVALAATVGASEIVLPDYRLAPEEPFPAAVDDVVAVFGALVAEHGAHRVVLAGDSAGGGLVVQTMLALRDAGLPQPVAGITFSPWFDFAMDADTYVTKVESDQIFTREVLQPSVDAYVGEHDVRDRRLNALHADLRGLAPVLVQVGSAEVLVADAASLALRGAVADVRVVLEVVPEMRHVFQKRPSESPEAQAALDRAGRFVRELMGHPTSAEWGPVRRWSRDARDHQQRPTGSCA